MPDARATETTTTPQPQGEVVKPQFRMPRRLFLKGAGLAMLLRAAGSAIRYIEKDRRSDLPVHWRIGFDALQEKDAEYLRDHPSVILGETAAWQLDSILPDASIIEPDQQDRIKSFLQGPREWMRAVGVGSDDTYRTHHNVLVRARESGSSMVATDGNFYTSVSGETIGQEHKPSNQAKMVMLLSVVGVGAGGLSLLGKERKRIGEAKKNGVPYKPSLPTRALGELMWKFNLMHWGDQAIRMGTPNRLQPGASMTGEMVIEMHNALTSMLSGKGGILVDAIEGSANASMALNAKIVQILLRQNPGLTQDLSPKASPLPLGIYFYTGSAHENVKDLYFSRTEYISATVEKIADRLIEFSVQELVTAEDQRNEPHAVLDSWIVLTSRFGYPIPSFARREQYLNGPKLDLLDSPRAILYKQLLKRIVKQGDEKGKVTDAYWGLLNRLAQEDMNFNGVYDRHVAPLRERAMRLRSQAELTIPFVSTDLVFFEGIPHWLPSSS